LQTISTRNPAGRMDHDGVATLLAFGIKRLLDS